MIKPVYVVDVNLVEIEHDMLQRLIRWANESDRPPEAYHFLKEASIKYETLNRLGLMEDNLIREEIERLKSKINDMTKKRA